MYTHVFKRKLDILIKFEQKMDGTKKMLKIVSRQINSLQNRYVCNICFFNFAGHGETFDQITFFLNSSAKYKLALYF